MEGPDPEKTTMYSADDVPEIQPQILKPARKTRSLTELAVVDGFKWNKEYRGYRVGIDASLWFFHAQTQQKGREGENPELRMFFFRLCKLMTAPFLPLFIFDGPKKPAFKRGRSVGRKADWMESGARDMIEAFGYECWTAPGEAEAELAYLNRIGFIDAVVTDDVDTLLFGASTIIRNNSLTLTGNKTDFEDLKNKDGKFDKNHVYTFSASDIAKHPETELTSDGLILIGLLSGGDYDQAGLARCGPVIARGLARAGLADSLCNAARVYNDEEMKVMFLPGWLEQVRAELRTNASGKLSRKEKALANNIDDNFIQLSVLRLYISPITSGSEGRQLPTGLWKREPDLGKLAAVCELRFEWGTEKIVLQRFRGNIFPGVVTRAVRFQAMQKDNLITRRPVEPQTPSRTNRRAAPGTPSSVIRKHFSTNNLLSGSAQNSDDSDTPIITQVSTTRNHASTDGILEYRLEIDPRAMVKATRGGFRGLRTELTEGFFVPCEDDDDPDSAGARKMKYEDPDSVFKMWLAADMVDLVEGDLVEAWKEEKENKLKKKATKGTRKKKNQDEDDSPPKKKVAAKRAAKKMAEEVSDDEPPSPTKARKKLNDPLSINPFSLAPVRERSTVCETLDMIFATTKSGTSDALATKKVTSSKPTKSTARASQERSSNQTKSRAQSTLQDDDIFSSSAGPSRKLASPKSSTRGNAKPTQPSKLSRKASSSSSDEGTQKKSPRKNVAHTSPRHMPKKLPFEFFPLGSESDSDGEEKDEEETRLRAKAAAKGKSKAKEKQIEYIDISDDEPLPPPKVAPSRLSALATIQLPLNWPTRKVAPAPVKRAPPRMVSEPKEVIEISD